MGNKTLISVALAALYGSVYADGYSNSPWLATIGVTKTIQSQSLGGLGLTLGVIDTGIVVNNAQVIGRVSPQSSCTNVSKGCGTTGIKDDTGHGTAVSSVAAGGVLPANNSMVGVAPKVTILMERGFIKGVASPVDYQNSIRKAVDAGADVINISGVFSASSVVIDSINYAASKGVYVVFSAGNNGAVFNNGVGITGLTPQGVKHLVLVGATNSTGKTKASFSNIPNSGTFTDSTGAKTTYATNWLMAPGEAIMAPYASPANLLVNGNPYAYWSGTSFSAPQVSGALILLESTWKILKTNSTAAELLFKTATSLGNTTTYGNGLLNVTKAFAPYGDLKITKADGSTISTSSLTTSMVASGALGNLSTLSSRLSSYNAFDSYTRNYAVNLSNMIVPSSTGKPTATLTTMAPVPIVSRFNGFNLSLTKSPPPTEDLQSIARVKESYASLIATDGGIVVGNGYGFSFGNSFATGLYNSHLAFTSDNLSAANSLVAIASGGSYSSYGIPFTENTRISFSQTNSTSGNWSEVSAKGSMLGFSASITPKITVALTTGELQENHGLLGSTYNPTSVLSLGGFNSSTSNAVSVGYELSPNSTVLVESLTAKVSVAPHSNGFTSNTSEVTANAWGIAYAQRNLHSKNDSLSFSIKSPLRVSSGTTQLFYQDVDTETGYPVSKTETVSLVPEGYEVQYKLGYAFNTSRTSKLATELSYSKDAGNVKGVDNSSITFKYSHTF